jgi:hypothetical protein
MEIERERDLIAHGHATRLERGVPDQPEVLATDRRRR